MEVGIDIEQNKRFLNLSQKFLDRAYTKDEQNYCQKFKNVHENYCALWCVKEAVVKAFSNRSLPFLEIKVTNTPLGRPEIIRTKIIEDELKKLGCTEIKISISHSNDYSTAICIIQ